MGRAYGYGSSDQSYDSFNDPPESWNEQSGSFNEVATCGSEQVVMMSDLVDQLFLPVCAYVEHCIPSSAQPAQPAPSQPMDGQMHTFAGDLFPNSGLSPYCEQLVVNRLEAADPYASNSDCAIYEAIAWVVKTLPACDGGIVLPRGVCLATAQQCASDITRAGCAALDSNRLPRSCGAFNEASDSGGGTQPPNQPNNP